MKHKTIPDYSVIDFVSVINLDARTWDGVLSS